MDWCFPEVKSPFKMPEWSFSSELDCSSHIISISKRACFFYYFCVGRKNLFSSLEFAPNDHFILVADGIDKKLRNKKSELRQNIIKNGKNHEVKPCFK